MSCARTMILACCFFQIIPLGTLVNAILCPFCKLKTVQAIWIKLHKVVKHKETMCRARTITLLCLFLELFSFDHLQCYFMSTP